MLQKYLDKVAELERDLDDTDASRRKVGEALYHFTKEFLDTNKTALTPLAKGSIFTKYLTFWKSKDLLMGDESFDKPVRDIYENHGSWTTDMRVKFVGLDFSGADVRDCRYGCVFVFINCDLSGMRFTNTDLESSDFYSCKMSGMLINKGGREVNMNKCGYQDCDLRGSDLSAAAQCENRFENCDMRGYKGRVHSDYKCTKGELEKKETGGAWVAAVVAKSVANEQEAAVGGIK